MSGLDELDERVRSAAFAHLRALALGASELVSFNEVFTFNGMPIRYMVQTGIWKPALLEAALSIRTVYAARPDQRPYDDAPGPDGYLRYKWRGHDPEHSDNRSLRAALNRQLPLIWFLGVERGSYLPRFPVWLVGEEPEAQQFVVALDDIEVENWAAADVIDLAAHRRYAERVARDRLHQPLFRARVLTAYEHRCAICRFRHPELLDAAHIRSDAEGGEPIVPNGISMCRLHHGAYDKNLLGIDPDRRIHIRPDVLEEADGPTLRHVLQELHLARIEAPPRRAAWPDRDLLAERFQRFTAAS